MGARCDAASELGRLDNGDPLLRRNLCRAIDQAISEGKQLRYSNVKELLDVIDHLTTFSPPFSEGAPVATPPNASLEWPMCMPPGYAVCRDPGFNAQLWGGL